MQQALDHDLTVDHLVEDQIRVGPNIHAAQVFLVGSSAAMWMRTEQSPQSTEPVGEACGGRR
ncbi:hypothetical protein PZ895_15430 [Mesorhizobium sp. YIM 152430]|uniref:hypothetical protein n=1 Tax=Mesorhizobium sp. YIM 152430 TaxID=3031761 RepID=UPI0023D98B7D|nr:hypothetical protein [Mesorhizobium sp. YIM 152430]MDF1601153.1 hypothetical protein [Mesorhizobium sp. YIM 152430]